MLDAILELSWLPLDLGPPPLFLSFETSKNCSDFCFFINSAVAVEVGVPGITVISAVVVAVKWRPAGPAELFTTIVLRIILLWACKIVAALLIALLLLLAAELPTVLDKTSSLSVTATFVAPVEAPRLLDAKTGARFLAADPCFADCLEGLF